MAFPPHKSGPHGATARPFPPHAEPAEQNVGAHPLASAPPDDPYALRGSLPEPAMPHLPPPPPHGSPMMQAEPAGEVVSPAHALPGPNIHPGAGHAGHPLAGGLNPQNPHNIPEPQSGHAPSAPPPMHVAQPVLTAAVPTSHTTYAPAGAQGHALNAPGGAGGGDASDQAADDAGRDFTHAIDKRTARIGLRGPHKKPGY